MERKRLCRGLSVAMLGLGSLLFILSIGIGQPTSAAFGTLGVFAGAACYRMCGQLFDTEPITFNPADSHVLAVNLLQLGLVLLAFALGTHFFSDVEIVLEASRTGLQTPTYLVYLGVIIGLSLGGGVAFLTFQWDQFQAASQAVPFRMIGFTATFGTYFLLLFSQPLAALAYAMVYTLSRLLVLLGMGPLSEW